MNYCHLNAYAPNCVKAGELFFSAQIYDELAPADACEGDDIDFVYTGIGALAVICDFDGYQYSYRYTAAYGDAPRPWIDLDDNDLDGLQFYDETRGEDMPIELDMLQKLEAAAGGSRALFAAIEKAAYVAAKKAQPDALDFLHECRAELAEDYCAA